MKAPRPGQPVRGSTTGRPLMAALDLFGHRWALRILWELRDGALGARRLLEQCDGLSSSVLYQRLRELHDAGVVRRVGSRWALTGLGVDLGTALAPLDAWSRRWAGRLEERDDPTPARRVAAHEAIDSVEERGQHRDEQVGTTRRLHVGRARQDRQL